MTQEPSGSIQVAVLNAVKDHAKTAQRVRSSLDHDFPDVWTFDDILKCMVYLERHGRIEAMRREDGQIFFKKVD